MFVSGVCGYAVCLGASGFSALCRLRQTSLAHRVGRAAFEHEPPVAIAAIDVTTLINLKKHAWMAQRGRPEIATSTDSTGTVTTDSTGLDNDRFGRCCAHGGCHTTGSAAAQALSAGFSIVFNRDCKRAAVNSGSLVRTNIERTGDPEIV